MSEAVMHSLDDLLTLMAALRDPQTGCPWDQRQDWDSIVPHTLEEAYEVADAIERRAFEELPGELGDLLFQVVYYCQFGIEERRFDFGEVVHVLTAKMLRRHPHVFPDGTLASRREGSDANAGRVGEKKIKQRWEALKAEERKARQATSILDDVPRALPALSRAAKLSRRASKVGFDWPDTRGVLAKIREELAEVEEALEQRDDQQVQAEIGDLLFAVTNLARHQNADPEQCLRRSNEKFERRFRHIEAELAHDGRSCQESSLAEMEQYWQAAKHQESH